MTSAGCDIPAQLLEAVGVVVDGNLARLQEVCKEGGGFPQTFQLRRRKVIQLALRRLTVGIKELHTVFLPQQATPVSARGSLGQEEQNAPTLGIKDVVQLVKAFQLGIGEEGNVLSEQLPDVCIAQRLLPCFVRSAFHLYFRGKM